MKKIPTTKVCYELNGVKIIEEKGDCDIKYYKVSIKLKKNCFSKYFGVNGEFVASLMGARVMQLVFEPAKNFFGDTELQSIKTLDLFELTEHGDVKIKFISTLKPYRKISSVDAKSGSPAGINMETVESGITFKYLNSTYHEGFDPKHAEQQYAMSVDGLEKMKEKMMECFRGPTPTIRSVSKKIKGVEFARERRHGDVSYCKVSIKFKKNCFLMYFGNEDASKLESEVKSAMIDKLARYFFNNTVLNKIRALELSKLTKSGDVKLEFICASNVEAELQKGEDMSTAVVFEGLDKTYGWKEHSEKAEVVYDKALTCIEQLLKELEAYFYDTMCGGSKKA